MGSVGGKAARRGALVRAASRALAAAALAVLPTSGRAGPLADDCLTMPERVMRVILGEGTDPFDLDFNGDGQIDIADYILAFGWVEPISDAEILALPFGTYPDWFGEAGTRQALQFTVQNTGSSIWTDAGGYRLDLLFGYDPQEAATYLWQPFYLPPDASVAPGEFWVFDGEVEIPFCLPWEWGCAFSWGAQMESCDAGLFGERVGGGLSVVMPEPNSAGCWTLYD